MRNWTWLRQAGWIVGLGTLAVIGCGKKEAAPPETKDAAAPPPTTAPAAVPAFRALGTEPFWALFIDASGLRFVTPEDTTGIRFPALTPTAAGDTLHWAGTTEKGAIDARIWPAHCSDGMSDKIWTHTAEVVIAGTTYRGCAEVDSPRADPIGDWTITGHRIPGTAAMSDADAAKWHGRVLSFGREMAVSNADTCRGVDYATTTLPADDVLAEYKIGREALGLPPSPVLRLERTELRCRGDRWAAPGGVVIWASPDRAFVPWDGVFFEIRRGAADPSGAASR